MRLAGVCISTLLGVGVVAATAGAAHAASSGGNGRLAYVYGGDVYTAKSDGYGAQRLTTTGDATGPRWSPDGTRIAYSRAAQLWVMNANGSAKHRVSTLTGTGRPAWSPDGKYLAVAANGTNDRDYSTLFRVTVATGATTTYTTDLSGGHALRIYPKATPVAWSANGRKLAVESANCGNGTLDENCLSTVTLASPAATSGHENNDHYYGGSGDPLPGRAYHPDWKPDSSAYVFTETYTSPVHLVLPSGKQIRAAFDAVYSPDGTKLAFVREEARTEIEVAHADGTHEEPAVRGGSEPDWQPTH